MKTRHRLAGLLLLLLLLPLLPGGAVTAGEEQGPGSPAGERAGERADRSELLARMLQVLHLRMEARLRAADTLREQGRLEDALEAYRGVEDLYAKEWKRFERLLAATSTAAGPPRPSVPPEAIEPPPPPPPPPGAEPPPPPLPSAPPTPQGWVHPPSVRPPSVAAEEPVDRLPGALHRAVGDALRWLAAHQSADGRWEAAGFGQWCKGKVRVGTSEGPGRESYDVGVTGLALLAFLGMEHDHQKDGPYAEAIGRGLRWLVSVQDAEGCIGPRDNQHFLYGHAAAAQALLRAYARTGEPLLLPAIQRALDFIAGARNPYLGWRYGVRPGDNDTSVTGWMIVTLAEARRLNAVAQAAGEAAPFRVDRQAFVGARTWVEKMTDPETGRTGYFERGGVPARPSSQLDRFPSEKSEAMTAVGIVLRQLTGEAADPSEVLKKGIALLSRLPPVWRPEEGRTDMLYWYYGTLALRQYGGIEWLNWKAELTQALLEHQRLGNAQVCDVRGTWDPVGPWGPDGGRVYSTALMALALETVIDADFP